MRAFIAIEVPKEISLKVAEIQPELPQDSIKPVETDKMHLTLRFLGDDFNDEQVPKVKEIVSSIEFDPFTVRCKGIGVFPNIHYVRVVWAGIDSGGILEDIVAEINEKLASAGLGKDQFTAHLTIARVRKRVDLNSFLDKHKDDVFGEFTVKQGDIKLKRSQLFPGGHIYTDL